MASQLTSVLADPGRLAAVCDTNLLDTPAEDALIGRPSWPPAC